MSSRRYIVFILLVLALSGAAIGAELRVASLRDRVQAQEARAMGEPDEPKQTLQYPSKPLQQADAMTPGGEETALKAYVTPAEPLQKGVDAKLTLALKDKNGKPVGLDALEERHTRKIHLLVVDESLSDYHHLHPQPGKTRGSYTFSFMPQTAHNYKLFADVKPVDGAAEMVPVLLAGRKACETDCIDKTHADTATVGDLKAKLVFDQSPLKVGTPAKGEVTVTDSKGAPLKNLEPVMGAYAHIVGFYDNFASVAHMHPLGDAPKDAKAQGAAPVKFMLHPQRAGFLKLFVQIRVKGEDVFIPFGVTVGD